MLVITKKSILKENLPYPLSLIIRAKLNLSEKNRQEKILQKASLATKTSYNFYDLHVQYFCYLFREKEGDILSPTVKRIYFFLEYILIDTFRAEKLSPCYRETRHMRYRTRVGNIDACIALCYPRMFCGLCELLIRFSRRRRKFEIQ